MDSEYSLNFLLILLKYLITAIAFYWLYKEVVAPFLVKKSKEQNPNIKQKDTDPASKKRFDDDEGEYIDYEEIK